MNTDSNNKLIQSQDTLKDKVNTVMVLCPEAIRNDNVLVSRLWQAEAWPKKVNNVSEFLGMVECRVLSSVDEILKCKGELVSEKRWLRANVGEIMMMRVNP